MPEHEIWTRQKIEFKKEIIEADRRNLRQTIVHIIKRGVAENDEKIINDIWNRLRLLDREESKIEAVEQLFDVMDEIVTTKKWIIVIK